MIPDGKGASNDCMSKTRKPRTTFRARLEEMVVTLREDILTGKRNPGDFLPAEPALAEQFELSKTSVRKGLEQLVEEGLILKIPRVGNRIAEFSGDSAITLRFAYHGSLNAEADLPALIDLFHERHPHIRIQPIRIPHPSHTSLMQDFIDRRMADVLTLNLESFEYIIRQPDLLAMLEPTEPDDELYPFLRQAFRRQGRSYAQPFMFSPVVLCYNKEHFREADISEPDSSWTWEDLRKAAVRLSSGRDRLGFACHIVSRNRWPIFLLQSGAEFGGEGREHLRDERVKAALQTSRELLHLSGTVPYLSESDNDVQELFLKQKVSVIMTSYFALNSMRSRPISYDIAPLPAFREARTLLLPLGLAVHRDCPHQEAAHTFVRFLMSRECQLHIRRLTLSIPAMRKAAEWEGESAVTYPSRYQLFREIVPTYRFIGDLGLEPQQMDLMLDRLKLYWSDIEPLDDVVAGLDTAFSQAVARI